MFGGGELADIGADFTEECQRGLDAHTLHGGEIHPELVEEVVAHRFVHLLGGLLRGRGWWALTVVIEGIHAFLDLFFAVRHEVLVEAPCFEGLTQGEEVLFAPVAVQGFGDLGLAFLAAVVTVAGEHLGVALARHDGVEDRQTGDTGNVGDDVVQLHVHLVECLLDAQEMLAGSAHEALAMAHERTHRTDRGGGPEGGVEQAHAVEVLQPLAILDVTLASRHVLDVAGVDETHLEAAVLEDLEERDPVDPGGLHRHRSDGAGLEPIRQGLEIPGEGPEVADRLRVAFRGHRHVMDGGSKVDAGGIRVQLPLRGDGFLLAGAGGLSGHDAHWFGWRTLTAAARRGKNMSILLCGVGPAQLPDSPPMTSRTASGTKLLDGLQ